MKKIGFYYIIPFRSTTAAMKVEKEVKEKFYTRIINTPRELAAGCGASLRIDTVEERQLIEILVKSKQSGVLYKMKSERIDGHHPIEKITNF